MSFAKKLRYGKYGPRSGFRLGTTGVGVRADHYTADGFNIVTKLRFNSVFPAVTGSIGVGLLAYTFPAGVHMLKSGRMSIKLNAQDGNVDADGPDLGLGQTMATGSVTTLSTAAWQDVLTGQTVTDCTGTVTEKTIIQATAAWLTSEAAGPKTVYLNVADSWAGSEAALQITGEVWLEWTRLFGV